MLPNYLDDADANEQAAIAKLLGLEPAPEGTHDRWGDALRTYANATDANGLRACLASSLVQAESKRPPPAAGPMSGSPSTSGCPGSRSPS